MSEQITVQEAARRLGVSRSTLYREHAEGKIKFVKVRGSTFVTLVEIERYQRRAER